MKTMEQTSSYGINGIPQKHIDRIKSIMQECNVKNYEIVRQ